MSERRKICVITGGRPDYGLLKPIMTSLSRSSDFQLQVVATCMHLSPEFGSTYKVIEKDGFSIDWKVDLDLSGDSPESISKSMGLGTIGFGDAFKSLKPDLVIVLGDRFELLAAVQTALVFRIPVAHFCGGDTTEGAMDEGFRHSMTKMSHLHFVSNELSAKRVVQMGEGAERVFNVGSPGIDTILQTKLANREEFQKETGFQLRKRNFLVTFHPVTLEEGSSGPQIREVLAALAEFGDETGVMFTLANADTEGRAINDEIAAFVTQHANAKAFPYLGSRLYFSAITFSNVVIGNSSSGLYEVPSFKVPTVNIGDRQKGRLQPKSVVNCSPKKGEIRQAIDRALQMDCRDAVNPYGDGATTARVMEALRSIPDYRSLIKKQFVLL